MLLSHPPRRGHGYDAAPRILPAGQWGRLVVLPHTALSLGQQSRRSPLGVKRLRAPQGQTPPSARPPTVCGSHAPPSWRRGCPRRAASHSPACQATRGEAPDHPTPWCPRHRAARVAACRRRLARRAGTGPPPRPGPAPWWPLAPGVLSCLRRRVAGAQWPALARPAPVRGAARAGGAGRAAGLGLRATARGGPSPPTPDGPGGGQRPRRCGSFPRGALRRARPAAATRRVGRGEPCSQSGRAAGRGGPRAAGGASPICAYLRL
jgi:hypothetical protein